MALDMFPCNPHKLLPAQQHEEGAAVVRRLQLQLQLSCDLLAVVNKMIAHTFVQLVNTLLFN